MAHELKSVLRKFGFSRLSVPGQQTFLLDICEGLQAVVLAHSGKSEKWAAIGLGLRAIEIESPIEMYQMEKSSLLGIQDRYPRFTFWKQLRDKNIAASDEEVVYKIENFLNEVQISPTLMLDSLKQALFNNTDHPLLELPNPFESYFAIRSLALELIETKPSNIDIKFFLEKRMKPEDYYQKDVVDFYNWSRRKEFESTA